MANIELPKDAEGREIPLDTECLYMKDGTKQNVDGFMFSRKDAEWSVETHIAIYDTEELYLTPPDSWEKLEEDMNRCIEASNPCEYYCPKGGSCVICAKPDSEICGCTASVFNDIKKRIRKLRGEGK